MAQFELNRTKDKSKIDAQPIKDGSVYLVVDEQSQSGDLYIDYDEKRYNVSGNVGYKKITTKGFKVVNWNGQHGENGTYTLHFPRKTSNIGDLTDESRKIVEELNKLNDKIQDDNISVYYTIMNDMNGDSFGKIVKINATTYSDIGLIILEVDKLYTNSSFLAYDASHYTIGQTGLNNYKDTSNSNAMGSMIEIYPDLGWMIKARENGSTAYSQQACLFINDHPELGTFDWFQDSYALSAENGNLAQGKTSFAQGQDNRAYGKYSFASGKQNKVGYADTAFGRENDLSQGQNIFAAGFGNKAENLDAAAYSTMLGSYNISGKVRNKLITGSYNNDKATNVFEIGNGGNEKRHNLFEVDKQGRIASNEKYLGGYKLYEGNINLSGNDLTNYLNNPITFKSSPIASNGYGPYLMLSNIKTVSVGWYILQVKITNTDTQSWILPTIRLCYGHEDSTDKIAGNLGFKTNYILKSQETIYLNLPIYLLNSLNREGHDITSFGFYGDGAGSIPITLDIEAINIFKAKGININEINSNYNFDIVTESNVYLNGLISNINQNYTIITTNKVITLLERNFSIFSVDQNKSDKILVFPSGKSEILSEKIYTSNELIEELKNKVNNYGNALIGCLARLQDLDNSQPNYWKESVTLLQPTEANNVSQWIEDKEIENSYTYRVSPSISLIRGTAMILGYSVEDGQQIDQLALSKIVVDNEGKMDKMTFYLRCFGELPVEAVDIVFTFIIIPEEVLSM